ncbi:hypothetical protein SOP93_17070 [Peribacillus frigoritolerans]|uniref:hypothetical protein n=1 Tax=Peribacillus frigoritolerans TaxID=450367 RepID=UPI002B23FE8A|nr:hypothetical protein [Peribacillus frigoritolerans]MEB2492878.1 hypothetical protein [Peribacillus frigoritolerans]
MVKEIFQISLDTEVLYKLRNKVNEEQNISFNKRYGKHRAWDRICAIMDRLDDTVDYLNGFKLNTGKYNRSAFDFYDFMNNASVVIDCVKHLAKIFYVSDEKIKNSTDIFNQVGKDGEGTDERYFEYLRSLCSVHPVETSRHKRYQDNDFECSPFVAWNSGRVRFNDDCDIYAVVYTSKDEENHKRVRIYITQIFEYVKTRLNFVSEITNVINQYQKQVISDFKNRPIKKEKEFDNYIDYLRNLVKEQTERYGSDSFYPFDHIINLFEIKLSNPENKDKMDLYLNALKYAIEFEHNSMQNMSNEGFENNGLLCPERNIETTLYYELCSPHSGSVEQRKYGYNLEKIIYLGYDLISENDKQWAYIQLEEASTFLEKYVSFEDAEGDLEHYALVELALYLDCLENKCLINKNIPNDLTYRQRLLSDNEMRVLFF